MYEEKIMLSLCSKFVNATHEIELSNKDENQAVRVPSLSNPPAKTRR